MKISDLEKILVQIKKEHGDLDVVCVTPDDGGYDCMDDILTVDLLSIGKANNKSFELGDCCNPDRPTVKDWLHIGCSPIRSSPIFDFVWSKPILIN